MTIFKTRIAIAAFLLLANGAAHASAFTNGSFEDHDATIDLINLDNVDQALFKGDTRITGWTIADGSINYEKYTRWQAADGNFSIDLNGENSSIYAIEQSFDTVAGQSYVVSFAMAGNPDGGPSLKALRASAGGSSADFEFQNVGQTRANMGWEERSFSFTAGASSTTLRFDSLTAGDYGPALDNIRVTAVPEPASLTLLAAGLAGLLLSSRRRWRV